MSVRRVHDNAKAHRCAENGFATDTSSSCDAGIGRALELRDSELRRRIAEVQVEETVVLARLTELGVEL